MRRRPGTAYEEGPGCEAEASGKGSSDATAGGVERGEAAEDSSGIVRFRVFLLFVFVFAVLFREHAKWVPLDGAWLDAIRVAAGQVAIQALGTTT